MHRFQQRSKIERKRAPCPHRSRRNDALSLRRTAATAGTFTPLKESNCWSASIVGGGRGKVVRDEQSARKKEAKAHRFLLNSACGRLCLPLTASKPAAPQCDLKRTASQPVTPTTRYSFLSRDSDDSSGSGQVIQSSSSRMWFRRNNLASSVILSTSFFPRHLTRQPSCYLLFVASIIYKSEWWRCLKIRGQEQSKILKKTDEAYSELEPAQNRKREREKESQSNYFDA